MEERHSDEQRREWLPARAAAQRAGLQPNSTVSEGIGYGMLLAVYMNDQTLFDGLWKY